MKTTQQTDDQGVSPELEGDGGMDVHRITRQTDLWLGQRHRIWYFLTGFGLACLIMWYVFLPAVLEESRRASDGIYYDQRARIQDQNAEIFRLTTENRALVDSLDRVSSIGVPLGVHTIPWKKETHIFGRMISILANRALSNTAGLDIHLDTCDYLYDADCDAHLDRSPIRLGGYCSIGLGSRQFYLECIEMDDSTITLALLERIALD